MKSILEINNRNVGYILYDIHHISLVVYQFRIFKKYQGKGYFKTMMEKVKSIAQDYDVWELRLKIGSNEVSEPWLHDLYSRYGFIDDDSQGNMILFL